MEQVYLYVGEVLAQAGLLGFFMALVGKLINIIGKSLTRGDIIFYY